MFGKYNGFVSKARVSACMYFLVPSVIFHIKLSRPLTTGGFTLHYESIFLMVNISADIYPPLKQNLPLKSSRNNLSNGGSSAVKTLHKPKQS